VSGEPYQPAPEVLRRLASVDFVAVVGPSTAGKTTLIRAALLREPRLRLVLNNTSRGQRPDEVAGVDYRFETRARMRARMAAREYVQVAPSVFGDLYATAAEDYTTDGVALLPVLADAVATFRSLPFRGFLALYVLPPSWPVLRSRLEQRRFSQGMLAGRLAEARRSLAFAMADERVEFVVNDDLGVATGDVVTLATRRPWSPRLRRDQDRARALARELHDAMAGDSTIGGSTIGDAMAGAAMAGAGQLPGQPCGGGRSGGGRDTLVQVGDGLSLAYP
jgi:guanylate kinase